MQSQIINIPTGRYYMEIPCTLNGATYILTMRYNPRSDGWTGDLADVAGNLLVAGFAFVTNLSLLAPYYRGRDLPDGVLFVLDSTGANRDPSRDSFASTHSLVFFSL